MKYIICYEVIATQNAFNSWVTIPTVFDPVLSKLGMLDVSRLEVFGDVSPSKDLYYVTRLGYGIPYNNIFVIVYHNNKYIIFSILTNKIKVKTHLLTVNPSWNLIEMDDFFDDISRVKSYLYQKRSKERKMNK